MGEATSLSFKDTAIWKGEGRYLSEIASYPLIHRNFKDIRAEH
ncbi:MAG: hypothetical protein PUA93_05095 [Eubacteriales bacterium]|nr:hypothetical protein [Eubacteriales bacterium]